MKKFFNLKRAYIANQAPPACIGKKCFAFLGFALIHLSVIGQDIHFSQFMNSPLNLNPSQVGNFKGSYRFVANARRQWSSVTIPYQTFGISADARDFRRIKNLGAGANIYYDRTGDSHFSTLVANIAASYKFVIRKINSEYITIGGQVGFTQRRIDYSNLSWDNQYNGYYYDPSLPSTETFANSGRIYPNLNAGVTYTKYFQKRKMISGGIALFNITTPKQSFFGNDQVRLDRRTVVNINGQYKINDNVDLLPSALFMKQGNFQEFLVGTNVKYILVDGLKSYRAVYFGAWGRAKDAGILSIGMDYDTWHVALSYDINMSNLRPASHSRGGFELAAIYIIPEFLPKRLKYKICPDFI